MKLFFIHLLLVLTSVVEVVTLLMIDMLDFVLQIKLKNMNVKVFNLMSGANETRFSVKCESCECMCGLDENVCNSKQAWNHNECRCEFKELK